MYHRLDVSLDVVLSVLVRGTRLALYAVLGVVVTYLPRLERCEVVGPDDLNSYAFGLVVQSQGTLVGTFLIPCVV